MKHIKLFEQFINSINEDGIDESKKEITMNVSVVTEAAQIPSNIEKFAKERGVLRDVKQLARWAEKAGLGIRGGTAIGKGYNTLVLDLTYNGAEVYFDTYTGKIKVNKQPVNSWKTFSKAVNDKYGYNILRMVQAHNESKKEITKYHKAAKKAGANKLSKIEPEYDDLYGHSFTFVDSDGGMVVIYYDKDQEGVAITQDDGADDISIDGMLKLIG